MRRRNSQRQRQRQQPQEEENEGACEALLSLQAQESPPTQPSQLQSEEVSRASATMKVEDSCEVAAE